LSGWQHANIAEIERRDGWIPIRDHFGIRALGTNGWVGKEAGDTVIPEHAELHGRHEELYVVFQGRATFTVAGDKIDARKGTLVFVRDPDALRSAVAAEPDTIVLTVGAKPGEAFKTGVWELAWRETRDSIALYKEQRYAEAAGVLREAAGKYPEHAGVHYNLACYTGLAGNRDEALEHLRIALDLRPAFRKFAQDDSDFAPIRDDPRFDSLVAGKAEAGAAGT
jgi:tetratricopeptide (TPR) repeat protein